MRARLRHIILGCLDAAMAAFAIGLALYLRFDGAIPAQYAGQLSAVVPLFVVVRMAGLWAFGTYRSLWRYATMKEALIATVAIAVGSAVLFLMDKWSSLMTLPRSVYIIETMIFVIGAGVPRLAVRLRRTVLQGGHRGRGTRALIVGAGDAGAMLVREFEQQVHLGMHVVGLIDDDVTKVDRQLGGVKVLGTRDEIADIVRRKRVERVIIAMPSVEPDVVRETMNLCKGLGVELKTLPPLRELVAGRVRAQDVRDVKIEDLLRREPVTTDLHSISGYLRGRRVLVTGAGGSIGSELCRQVCAFDPAQIVLLEHSENSIFEIESELKQRFAGLDVVPVIGDIRDGTKLDRVFARLRPHVVFHAAAHKHVPLMEANPDEAVANNVFGTRNVARAAARHGAERFVMVSTDKAVNPANVMGATKRMAELVVQGMHERGSRGDGPGRAAAHEVVHGAAHEAAHEVVHGTAHEAAHGATAAGHETREPTRFVSVRFGNVLDSRGSVIPIFRRQIQQGGPVTVTHPDMTRYFMTIPEAVQLIIQAAAIGDGGEVFVLDMGEPVRIADLAHDLIRLSGYTPGEEIDVVYTGIRPGEKLFEELVNDSETVSRTSHDKIMALNGAHVNPDVVDRAVARLERLLVGGLRDRDEAEHLVSVLYKAVNGQPSVVAAAGAAGVSDVVGEPAGVSGLPAEPEPAVADTGMSDDVVADVRATDDSVTESAASTTLHDAAQEAAAGRAD